MTKKGNRIRERIAVDRKIVEGLRAGKSLTSLSKECGKGKGFVIKIRDLALQYDYINRVDGDPIKYISTSRRLPVFPELIFPIKDGRSERYCETDNILDSHRAWIKERLYLGWSPQTIFEEIPVGVPRASLYRYIGRHNLKPTESVSFGPEIIQRPGESLQIDWGKLCDRTDASGKKKIVWFFLGTLGHSRYQMVRIVESGDFATTIEAITSMLNELGGVPGKITCDNPKVFVTTASKHEPVLNPGFERFAAHYGFTIEALPPRDPKKKGKVERSVKHIRRLYESYDFQNYSHKSAQDHAELKLKIANERKHGSHQQKPIEVFLRDEATALKKLPALPYEIETITYPTIRRDGYVQFDNKYYRVDDALKGQDALVVGNSNNVTIYCHGRLLEVYERITDPFITKACKDHYKQSWEKTISDHGHYLDRGRAVGENVVEFLRIVLARGEGFVDTRVTWGILSLTKKYESKDIDNACKVAIEISQVNLRTVKSLLSISSKEKLKKQNSPETLGGKFVRPMSVYTNHIRLVYSST